MELPEAAVQRSVEEEATAKSKNPPRIRKSVARPVPVLVSSDLGSARKSKVEFREVWEWREFVYLAQ